MTQMLTYEDVMRLARESDTGFDNGPDADLIERQAAQIEVMREALGHALNGILYYHHAKLVKFGIDAANEALSISPDQALEQFAAKVREQCALIVDQYDYARFGAECAEKIRSIKELP